MSAVVVLYDYVAQTEDEMSVVEGEYLGLTEVGKSFGEGWAEVRFAAAFGDGTLTDEGLG